jgi:hypothetical protein
MRINDKKTLVTIGAALGVAAGLALTGCSGGAAAGSGHASSGASSAASGAAARGTARADRRRALSFADRAGPGGERSPERGRDGHAGAGADRKAARRGQLRAVAGAEPAGGQAGLALLLPQARSDARGGAGPGTNQGRGDADAGPVTYQGRTDAGAEPGALALEGGRSGGWRGREETALVRMTRL